MSIHGHQAREDHDGMPKTNWDGQVQCSSCRLQIADFFSGGKFIITSFEGGGGRGAPPVGALRGSRDATKTAEACGDRCSALLWRSRWARPFPSLVRRARQRVHSFPCVAAFWFLLTELVSCRMGSLDEAYSWRTATRPRRRFAERGACPRPAALRAALARLRRASGQCGRHRSSFHGGERAAGADTG